MTLRLPSIPSPASPPMDPNTPGVWITVWYNYLRALDQALREVQIGTPVAFAGLPASPFVGRMAIVNNSNTQVWGANANGSGTLTAFVIWNGSNWTVFGK